MNIRAVKVIYKYEMMRAWDTVLQSFASPVITTVLYFVVFGSAIGSRIETVEQVSYGAFIIPGLLMLAILTQSVANASFGIYFPRFTGTIYEILSAPISFVEILLGFVGAAAALAASYLALLLLSERLARPIYDMKMPLGKFFVSVLMASVGYALGDWLQLDARTISGFLLLSLNFILVMTAILVYNIDRATVHLLREWLLDMRAKRSR